LDPEGPSTGRQSRQAVFQKDDTHVSVHFDWRRRNTLASFTWIPLSECVAQKQQTVASAPRFRRVHGSGWRADGGGNGR
jgi:hypothetical protein